jgi:aspartate aminotransferase-like enzyme
VSSETRKTQSGRHFLQIPGPTNVPDRVLRAMDRAVVDHRGPELPEVTFEVVANLRRVFGTEDALNELEVLATLGGVELALDLAGEKVELGSGVAAAQRWFQEDGW